MLLRHYKVDCCLFTQQWNSVDLKIRVITDRVYYVYKTPFLGHWITKYYRIPYGIIIPDPKKSDGQKLGEIIQGYAKPDFFVRLFCPRFFRPKYYKYFDSFEAPVLDPIPQKYQPNPILEKDKSARKLAIFNKKSKRSASDQTSDEEDPNRILQELFQK